MSLLDSLLGAVLRLEGDSLVLHTGEKPYVVTSASSLKDFRGPLAWGQVELSTRALTSVAVMSLLQQVFDQEQLRTLDELGAVEYLLPAESDRPAFQVVAARGGDELWVEVRPVRPHADEAAPRGVTAAATAAQPSEVPASGESAPGPTLSAGVEQEQRRLAAARAEVERLEEHAREASARLAALREETARLQAERDEAARVAEAARLEENARHEAARASALREEGARLDRLRAEAARAESAAREEASRVESLKREASRLEALREQASRIEAEKASRIAELHEEARRLEALRAEQAQIEAAARAEAARVHELRDQASLLERARSEAAAAEAARRQEADRVAALRLEAERLEAARAEAARLEAIARAEAARVEALRDEAAHLEAARAEAARVEAIARAEAARADALREEALRLEAALAEAARVEAVSQAEAARVDALKDEAARLEAARADAVREEAAARDEAARLAEAMEDQNLTLQMVRREVEVLRTAIRAEAERLEATRQLATQAEEARLRAESDEEERQAAAREAQRREEARVEALRAEAEQIEARRIEHEAALFKPALEDQSTERVARRAGEERLQALVAALRDESVSRRERPVTGGVPPDQGRLETQEPEPGPFVRLPQESPQVSASDEQVPEEGISHTETEPAAPAPGREPEDTRPAPVIPLVRSVREQPAAAPAATSAPDLDRLLRIAAARGASGLYLESRSQPAVRIDGDVQTLDGEEPLAAADVEAFMLGLVPEPSRDSVKSGATVEWFCEVPEIGRVRCLSFRDHRGPGVIIRMLPARAVSAEQLGLSKGIQALSAQADGLVLIAGPRASGKSTMLAAFVDLINRTRADHVITIERQITFAHESQRAFVSQREVRGEAHEVLAAVREALREDPDVLVVEELRSPDVVSAALESAESGRLVVAGLRAPASAQALERLMNQVPADARAHALTALSTSLRGVVSNALLRKRAGGRVAARELLLNTPAVAAVLAEGKLFQIGAALESGRKLGSVPLNDSLVALVRDGVVEPAEAWRKAYDREALLTLLKREGIDTSFVERLA